MKILKNYLVITFLWSAVWSSFGFVDESRKGVNDRILQDDVAVAMDGGGDCDSVPLLDITESLLVLTGSTLNATEDVLACFGDYRTAVFYQFVATGARYRISTCHAATDFDTALIVGDTTVCNDVGCSDNYSEEDADCDVATGAATMEFFSQPDVTYTIALMGVTVGSTGNFGLYIQEYILPANDVCEGVEMVEPSLDLEPVVIASTVNATPKGLSCEAEERIGVYYQFEGTGARFRVSTCDTATTFNTSLVVDDSVCSDMGCTALYEVTMDDNCDLAPDIGRSMEFRSEQSVNYTVFLRGASSNDTDKGDFGLIVMEYLRPDNDVCTAPVEIDLDGESKTVVTGSTENATISEYSCLAEWYPTVFYTVVGTGEMFHASTCATNGNSGTNGPSFNTSILVNEGACEGVPSGCTSTQSDADFDCDPEVGHAATVSWETTQGVVYTIAVKGVGPMDTGSFQLQVQAGGNFTTTSSGASNNAYHGAWVLFTVVTSAVCFSFSLF